MDTPTPFVLIQLIRKSLLHFHCPSYLHQGMIWPSVSQLPSPRYFKTPLQTCINVPTFINTQCTFIMHSNFCFTGSIVKIFLPIFSIETQASLFEFVDFKHNKLKINRFPALYLNLILMFVLLRFFLSNYLCSLYLNKLYWNIILTFQWNCF